MKSLPLTGRDLTLEIIAQIADPLCSIETSLTDDALQGVLASRAVIDAILERGEAAYGVNTGFGALSDVRIAPQDVDALQLNLLRSHAAGAGPLLEARVVRAMLLLRANTLAQGYSGVRPEVITQLLALLNRRVHPAVPSQGSLGASGDLAPLAHLALPLIGEGWVLDSSGGRPIPAADALAAAGLTPLTLKAKEGLALLNGTQMMTALGSLTLLQAERLALTAEIAAAMTVEAVRGSVRPFDARVAELRPHPGHARSAAVMRRLLAHSEIMASHRDCAKVQDPYSLRCIPQVHGAVWDALAAARRTLEIEANAVTDNPLVFPDGDVVSQGNFHGEPVAMALDAMAVALAELGSIAERRIDKLMNPVFSGLPAFLTGHSSHPGLNSGMMIVHYAAASLASENKTLAHPACVDSIPTSNDKEDHVSMGALAARKAAQILENVRWIVAAELLCAAQGLEFRKGAMPGKGVWAAYQAIRAVIPPLEADRSCADDVRRVAQGIADDQWLGAVEAVTGPL